jgi:hypothetical protein
MNDLQMNWTKLTPDLKDKVLDIMVDGVLSTDDYNFKANLLSKLGVSPGPVTSSGPSTPSMSSFGSKSRFGSLQPQTIFLIVICVVLAVIAGYTIYSLRK